MSSQADYSRRKSAETSNIGPIPAVVDPDRRERCRLDLLAFLTTYFPQSTGLKPFSDGHKRVIARLQQCILEGGRFCEAVYRGWAKTTIGENTALWATLYGHRRFVAIFGADAGAAENNIDSMKMELAENDLLNEDFPEVCFPIRSLEGKPQRCKSQTYTVKVKCGECRGEGCPECEGGVRKESKPTHIEWTAETIVLPAIEGSPAAGAILTARGITAGSRGMKHKRPDGTQQRPDFLFIDDPQTDESAKSPAQVQVRMKILKKNLLRLGGHNQQIAVVIAATVIEADDMIDQLLDSKKNPSWQGERIPMVEKWADAHEKMWMGEYFRLRTTYEADIPGAQAIAHAAATDYYRQNKAAMDAGCVIAWEHCFDDECELSAIQHAYNALIDDGEEVFASEFQNRPLVAKGDDGRRIDAGAITKQLNGVTRGVVPLMAHRLTAFIDVQGNALFWLVLATSDDFTGAVVDYGAFPQPKQNYFTLADFRGQRTLKGMAAQAGVNVQGDEGAIFWGLGEVTKLILGRTWLREDGVGMPIARCLVDANWGDSTDIVFQFCRNSTHAARLMPSHGRYVGVKQRPWSQWVPKQGDRIGLRWRVPASQGKRTIQHVAFDTNYWKTFIHQRLRGAVGDKGRFRCRANQQLNINCWRII
jgi:hypothetical protein